MTRNIATQSIQLRGSPVNKFLKDIIISYELMKKSLRMAVELLFTYDLKYPPPQKKPHDLAKILYKFSDLDIMMQKGSLLT